MSSSGVRKCDRCGLNFEAGLGCLNIDVNFYTDVESMQGWSEIRLCQSCAKPIIDRIRPACNDLEEILPP
jgi:hypothetical protein